LNFVSDADLMEAQPVWIVFKKLMSPLEYLLFGTNMVFLVHFSLYESAKNSEIYQYLPVDMHPVLLSIDERMHALEMMAHIDHLLLFFFALKVCLKFS